LKVLMKAVVLPYFGAPETNAAYHYLQGDLDTFLIEVPQLIVLVGFAEELVFRGYLINRIQAVLGRSFGANVVAVLLTAAIFGPLHYFSQVFTGHCRPPSLACSSPAPICSTASAYGRSSWHTRRSTSSPLDHLCRHGREICSPRLSLRRRHEPSRMPAVFVGHGSPMNAIEDNAFSREWRALGERLPRPKAILCVSAHWETRGVALTAMAAPKTIHDFYGFPQALFDVRYPAPATPSWRVALPPCSTCMSRCSTRNGARSRRLERVDGDVPARRRSGRAALARYQ